MKKKINLCYVIGTFQAGGAQNHLYQLCYNRKETLDTCIIVVFDINGSFKEKFQSLGIPIYEIPITFFNYPKSTLKFYQILKKHNINVIHSHLVGTLFFSLFVATLAKVKNKIITWHSVYKPQNKLTISLIPILQQVRYFFRLKVSSILSDKIIAVSQKVNDENCNYLNVPPNKTVTVYNGIEHMAQLKEKRNKNKVNLAIGAVGALQEYKGYQDLLLAIDIVIKKYPKCILYIAGDGPYKANLISIINELQLDSNVVLIGHISDIDTFLNGLDIWIMPSHREGFSLAVLEAMRAGLPIIATDVGGNAEAIKDKESGIVVNSGNFENLSRAILNLINNPELRILYSRNAQSRFNSLFTMDKMLNNLKKQYHFNI